FQLVAPQLVVQRLAHERAQRLGAALRHLPLGFLQDARGNRQRDLRGGHTFILPSGRARSRPCPSFASIRGGLTQPSSRPLTREIGVGYFDESSMWNSTRRLFARPASVSFLSIGRLRPNPSAWSRSRSTPSLTRPSTTACARCCESVRLY